MYTVMQFLVAALFALLVHEYGHLTAALLQGVHVKLLGCNKFGAFIRRERSITPWRELVIALCGPLANLIAMNVDFGNPWWHRMNLVLAVSNLLPVLKGSDGLRILHIAATRIRTYYNEIDPFAAAWLRELIKAGHIAPGEVDERSIVDVQPDDLRGFTQCHFFAGIGVWSYALRAAGWSDDTPVWTGSCPCQGFSASGKRGGFSDKRHLWPAWFRLIRECRPNVCFGEQVASKDGLAWFDVVSSDMEGEGYAIGAADTCAAGFGAPQIRQRLYFVANAQSPTFPRWSQSGNGTGGFKTQQSRDSAQAGRCSSTGGMEYPNKPIENGDAPEREQSLREPCPQPCGVGDSDIPRLEGRGNVTREHPGKFPAGAPSFTNGFWRDADWIWCRDGKYRPIEPGTFPLASGIADRMEKVRGYGNGLNAEQAKGFIQAYIEVSK
jgi:DNA (cytosine-5)-methyltransferase 1